MPSVQPDAQLVSPQQKDQHCVSVWLQIEAEAIWMLTGLVDFCRCFILLFKNLIFLPYLRKALIEFESGANTCCLHTGDNHGYVSLLGSRNSLLVAKGQCDGDLFQQSCRHY